MKEKQKYICTSVSNAVLLKLCSGSELPRSRRSLAPRHAGQWDKVACIIYASPESERVNTPKQIR